MLTEDQASIIHGLAAMHFGEGEGYADAAKLIKSELSPSASEPAPCEVCNDCGDDCAQCGAGTWSDDDEDTP